MLLFIFVFSVGSTPFVIWRQFRRYKKRLAMRDHYVKIGEQQETKIMFKKWVKFHKFTSIKNLPEVWRFIFHSKTVRNSHRWCSMKKVFLKISQNLKENIFVRLSFLIKFFKKETLAQVSSCKVCKIFTKTLFIEHLWAYATASKARLEEAKKGFMRPWIAHENFRKKLILDIIIQDDKISCIFVMPTIGLLKCMKEVWKSHL